MSQPKVRFQENFPERRAKTGQLLSILTADSQGVSAQTRLILGEWHPLLPVPSAMASIGELSSGSRMRSFCALIMQL